ncbi:1-aminocyclopropane-1-carboxylate deaminase/D-cysteine desulfhydrase [Pseudaminobacter soli (ex Li et al. 2025)]|uniref:1-aminocyclopropane-1-carboxylate deaminase/D-cysteine desulfhydrase n=1 Tax=Pseudaminobacter soli (ex Li et al. 2025) TaxID=1295366 RepID=UPI001FDFBF25|nr:pyridoxal-phosphate dependent enzyme [Mesorhizobium soli]
MPDRASALLRDPRHTLLHMPTPLQRLGYLEAKLERPGLYMKRDDLMEIALGGNKLRSLEFWLGAAKRAGADVLLVAGGAMSNLCRLTAAAAAMTGFDCIVFHNSADNETNRQRSFLNKLFGAEVRYLGPVSEQQRGEAILKAAAELAAQGRVPYIVGDAVVGALGYVVAAAEMHDQVLREEKPLRHVFLAGSMGPTEAGFIFGNALLGSPFEVHLVSVEYGQAELAARVNRIYDDLRRHTGLTVPDLENVPVHYHMDYLGDGYGQPTPQSEQAIISLARTEGILIEHVYTAKTFAGFVDLAVRGHIPEDEPACLIHTGGTPSLFSQFGMFKSIG